MRILIADDWQRGAQAIRVLRLSAPSDPVGSCRIPKDPSARRDLVDAVFDLTDQWAARAILDGPPALITWQTPNP